jgi:hypothetical protein
MSPENEAIQNFGNLIDDGPSHNGVIVVEEARKVRKKSPPIPMTLFASALTHHLIYKHDPNIRVCTDLNIDVPNPNIVGHRGYLITIKSGRESFNANRQRFQHVIITAWSRDGKYSHVGISAIDCAVKKYIRGKEISKLMKDKNTDLNFIELTGYYYTLLTGKEAMC